MSRSLAGPAFARGVWCDLRSAARTLSRSPGLAALVVGIMALGIGANTAIFSVVNGVLLKPLPYPGADRIVAISTALLTKGEINPLVSIANFRDWRARSSSFEAMATYRGGETPVMAGAEAEYVRASIVDARFFAVFGVQPLIGRTFSAEEGGPGKRAVMISHAYWQTRFGGDQGVLQKTVRFGTNTDMWPIVGVLPPGFRFPGQTDIWAPEATRSTSRTNHGFFAVGRIKPGVSLERAHAELAAVAAALQQEHPESNQGRGVSTVLLQDRLVGNVRLTLYLLWGVVGIVLLIACANTATLLLGQAVSRTREIAVRAALGASRFRIARQLLAESLLLALIAGAAGLLIAMWGTRVLVALSPFDTVRVAGVAIDARVLAITLGVCVATSLVFGLVPALYASRVELMDALKQRGAPSGTGRSAIRTRGVLVVSEIAMAVVLLTGAGLVMKSLMALHDVELGYRAENALVMKATGVRPFPETTRFFRDVMARIAALPGVVAVGATMVPPGDLSNSGNGSYFVDRIPENRDRTNDPFAFYNVVSPGLFRAAGIPLRAGRDFSENDAADRPLVAIVNEELVRRSFAGENPIGRTLFCSFDRSQEGMTIVGVVGDVRQASPATTPLPECYMPYGQHTYNSRTLHVIIRSAGDPGSLAGPARKLAAEIAPDVPVSFTTMAATLSQRIEEPRFRAILFAVFSGIALCLAIAGVYGVMAYAVVQRSKEIGLRIALGASRASVLRLIQRQGLVLAAAGLTAGLAGAVAATRLLTAVLFGVEPSDPSVYAAVVALLAAVTLAAGYLPARRAASVDPVKMLKID
jgi:putative ABC transport system permease protein